MVQKFSIQIDFYSKIITTVVSFFLIMGIFASNFNPIVIAAILFAVILALSFFPLKYELTPKEIIIKKAFFSDKIPLEDIISITPVGNITSYTFSSKGFLGYLGKTMDGTTSYSTDLKNNLLIICKNDRKILISPREIESFVATIEKYS